MSAVDVIELLSVVLFPVLLLRNRGRFRRDSLTYDLAMWLAFAVTVIPDLFLPVPSQY